MRAYTVAATAVTLGVHKKWIDNVLSHHQVEGVVQTKQGNVRRVTPAGLVILEIALHLHRTMEIPIKVAVDLATQLKSSGGGEVALSAHPSIVLRVDVDSLTQSIAPRLNRALEITPTPRRGRPPRK